MKIRAHRPSGRAGRFEAKLHWTSVLLLMVALAAIYLPARRAASIDPLRALRQE